MSLERVVAVRRSVAKRPRLGTIATRILARYTEVGFVGCGTAEEAYLGQAKVAPPPGEANRGQWKIAWRALGPIELLLQSIHEMGAVLDPNFTVHGFGEPAVRILGGPFNQMKTMLGEMFVRARTAEAQGKRKDNEHIFGIDLVATQGHPKQHNGEHNSLLRILQSG